MADADTLTADTTAPGTPPTGAPTPTPPLPRPAPAPSPLQSNADDSALGPLRPYTGPASTPSFWDNLTQPGPIAKEIESANPFADVARSVIAAAPEVIDKEIPYAHESSLGLGPGTAGDLFNKYLAVGQYGAETSARENSTADWLDKNIADIKQATGVELPNPNYGGFSEEASAPILDQINKDRANGTFTTVADYVDRVTKMQLQLFQQAKQDLASKHQTGSMDDASILDAIKPNVSPQDAADALVKQAQATAESAYQGADATALPWLASTAGEMVGSYRNPINLLGLTVGGVLGAAPKAATLLGRMAWAGVDQALINMGLTAAQEPERQKRAAQLNEDNGLLPALKDIETSALFGFVPGAVIHGIHEIGGRYAPDAQPGQIEDFIRQANNIKYREDWNKGVNDFFAEKAAREAAAAPLQIEGPRAPGEPPAAPPPGPRPAAPPTDVANLRRTTEVTPGAIESAELDHEASPPRIDGVEPGEMLSSYQGAVLHGEHPDIVAPPTPALYAPPAPHTILAPDHTGTTTATVSNVIPPQMGTSAILDGRPMTQNVAFDPRQLTTDAQAMQYKSGGDAQGVTNRLQGVEAWDDLAANKIVVYQRLNGDLVVADGHQRLGLAKRLLDEGKESHISLIGSLFKESDGWTPADVRAQAAAKNIKESSGSALDIARVLRDRPSLWDRSMPTTEPKVKQGKGLSELSDPAWGMALNGTVKENHAALVGLNVPDKSLHEGIMGDLARVKPAGENEARMVIADGRTAGYRKEIQEDIFGKTERTVSLIAERSQVYGAVVRLLKEDKRIFGMLDRNAEKIESVGNQLVDSNADQAARAEQLAQIIIKIAERQGPLSAALNKAANAVAEGKPVAAAAREFLDHIDQALEAEGIKASMLTPGSIDLTTPKGRDEQTRALMADAKEQPPLMAFHGSPHSFEAFDTGRIGSGEGHQTFGHGFYFAENKDIARGYMEKLSPYGRGDKVEDIATRLLQAHDGNRQRAIAEMERRIASTYDRMKTNPTSVPPETFKEGGPRDLEAALELLRSGDLKTNLYQVALHVNKDRILDWDKPLSEQSVPVRDAIERLLPGGVTSWGFTPETGEDLVRALGHEKKDMTQANSAPDKAAAAKALQEAGVEGIRYLDAASRAVGDGTRNVVIFDPRQIEITHRNGEPIRPADQAEAKQQFVAERNEPAITPTPTQNVAPLVTGDSLVDHVTSDPYVASAIADPVINRANDVPYGAGPNTKLDQVVNVDRHVPAEDKIGGVTYDPARAVAVHEFTEQHALNELTKAGVPEATAYEIAHFVFAEPAERAWVEANVGPKAWGPYQAHWNKWLSKIDHENPKNPPPDLYQKPYPHDDDHLAPEDRGSDKKFEVTGHHNLPELRAEAERVLGPGGGGAPAQLEQIAREAVANAHQALGASGTPLDRAADQAITEHVEPFLDRAFPKAPPATEAGPEGTQQTLAPGVAPVTDADRLRAAAGKPMTGGAAEPPAGGLFDETARRQKDLWDVVATDEGLVDRDELMQGMPRESTLAEYVEACKS